MTIAANRNPCAHDWPHQPLEADRDEHGHDHDHGDGHGHGHDHGVAVHRGAARKALLGVMALTGSTMVVEAVGGVLSGSLALLSDAGHMLSHFLALGVSYLAIRIAAIKAAEHLSFGLYRVEVLAALLNAATLLFFTGFIFYEAIERLRAPEEILTGQMLVIGAAGLVVNLVSAWMLHGSDKHDISTRSAFLHMLGDLGGSIAVVGGALLIRLTGWLFVDALLSMMIGGLILAWSWSLIRESVLILLESTPRSIDPVELARSLRERFPEVRGVHDLHVWEITSRMYAMTAHVVVDDQPLSGLDDLMHRIRRALADEFHIGHANLQFEAARPGDEGS